MPHLTSGGGKCCQTHQVIQESGLPYICYIIIHGHTKHLATRIGHLICSAVDSHQLNTSQTTQPKQSSNSFSLVLGKTEASFYFPYSSTNTDYFNGKCRRHQREIKHYLPGDNAKVYCHLKACLQGGCQPNGINMVLCLLANSLRTKE